MPAGELAHAVELLKRGEVVGMPTETVYGLAGAIDSENALRQIFAIKQRPFFDPLIVHVATLSQAKTLTTHWPPPAQILAERFWPGPLSLVLPKSEKVHSLITSGLETVAIRMPAHPLARQLIDAVGVPLAAPSANLFGKTSPTSAEHVRAEFHQQVLVLDGGPCAIGVESTVASVNDNAVVILRPGSVTREMMREALGSKIEITSSTNAVASPGHLEHHYMPDRPLVIVQQADWPLTLHAKLNLAHRLKLQGIDFIELPMNSEPALAARELYQNLRECADRADAILVVKRDAHTNGFWTAIWDRLQRASTMSY